MPRSLSFAPGSRMPEPIATPEVIDTADGSRTLFAPRERQGYGSRFGALTEAEHVYVDGVALAERLAAWRGARAGEGGSRPSPIVSLLEIGFGTGLNFLCSLATAWRQGAPLDYIAYEHDLPTWETLRRLHFETLPRPDAADLAEALLAWRAALPERPPAGVYRATFACPRGGAGRVRLTLHVADARVARFGVEVYDGIYHDPFSPEANPALWTPGPLARLARALRPADARGETAALRRGGVFATYCVRGAVRRALQGAGLRVEKRPGPPAGKGEVLIAYRPRPPEDAAGIPGMGHEEIHDDG